MRAIAAIVAFVLVICGLIQLLQGDFLWAFLLFIAACVVGPGGISLFKE